jgi:hypothetical protein
MQMRSPTRLFTGRIGHCPELAGRKLDRDYPQQR